MSPHASTVRALIVEPDETGYLRIRDLLRGQNNGYDVHWAPDFAQGLAALTSGQYDVHVVGLSLGASSGLDLIRASEAAGCHAPCILVADADLPGVDLEAQRAGAAAFLVGAGLDGVTLDRSIRYAVEHGSARALLRSAEARFRSVVQQSSDLVAIIDFENVVTYVSPSIERLFGHRCEDVVGHSLLDLAHPADAGYLAAKLTDVRQQADRSPSFEWRVKHARGEWRHSESVMANLLNDPNVAGIVVTTRDIHDRKSLEAQLSHQAFHDPLTDIPNRALFARRADLALARARVQRRRVAVLFLDLDDFKTVNDSQGHSTGDILLTAVAARVRDCVRADDTVARFGGDEFAVLLERGDLPRNAVVVAERIFEALRRPFSLDTGEVTVSASVGIAVSDVGAETSDELLRNADMAMYMAKERGRAGYTIFEAGMHRALVARLEMESDLRRAVDCEQFMVEFQPIVRLDSGALAGFEALVRWRHPSGKLVPPSDFIPLAEETGLIVPMGRWVINRACRRIRRLQEEDQPRLSMTVNVSGRQLQQPDFADDVAKAILVEGIDPGCLVLEITETVMMQDTEATLTRLSELKALGVRLAIDDFGTGYSSLNYLHKFPVDILKIDRSFVQRISETGDGAVARAIIGLSKALRLTTVAEGIEEAEQAAALTALGCELGQGYYFAKPISEDALSVAVRALQVAPVTQQGLEAARWPRLVRKSGSARPEDVPRKATA